MSVHKSKVVVGTGATPKGPKSKLRKVFALKRTSIAVAVVLVAVVVAGVTFALMNKDTPTPKSEVAKQAANDADIANSVPEGTTDEAQALASKGDVTAANKKLTDALATAKSNGEKHSLLVAQAVIALNQEQYQTALDLIAQAEKLGDTRASSDTGAMAAESLGNKPLAIEYYNKTLARLDKSDPLYASEKRHTDEAIEKLSQ